VISLKDAVDLIEQHDYRDGKGPFKIVFLTCHREKKEGGELIVLDKACGMGLPPNCKGHEMRGVKCMDTGKKYAVHNRLIFQINGQEVYWV
jgi:hypothetical protein